MRLRCICNGQLQAAIGEYIEHHNSNPKPFIWTASAQYILAKVTRAKAAQIAVARQVQNRVTHDIGFLTKKMKNA